MGWAGIAIAEEFGGLGYGYTGLGLVLEQAGRNLSASPLQSTVLVAATVIAQLGSKQQKEHCWPRSPAARSWSLWRCRRVRTTHRCRFQRAAERDGDAWVINGSKLMVLDASSAQTFIVIARTSGSPGDEQGPERPAGGGRQRTAWR